MSMHDKRDSKDNGLSIKPSKALIQFVPDGIKHGRLNWYESSYHTLDLDPGSEGVSDENQYSLALRPHGTRRPDSRK